MKRALNMLPTLSGHYGFDVFNEAAQRNGFVPLTKMGKPSEKDILFVWNRQGSNAVRAHEFARAGARIVVVENGYLGKHALGSQWYAMALAHHNGAGQWPALGPERWASLGLPLAPWRKPGGETVVLGQRGIGEAGIASPKAWEQLALRQVKPARLRPHPGPAAQAAKAKPLEEDLVNASAVVTWGSSAALTALRLGIPVYHDFRKWIGGLACRHLDDYRLGPVCDDGLRLKMFERMAWAMWRREEVATGDALDLLLSYAQ